MRMGKLQLIKAVSATESGTTIYINAIAMTTGAIDRLRKYIQDGEIIPIREEVEKMLIPDAVDRAMNGEIICPQMSYIIK